MTSEQKRKRDRERIAAIRAAMTPEERADARREQDRLYRERHREERRHADLLRRAGKRVAKHNGTSRTGEGAS